MIQEGIINNIGKYLKVNIGKYQSFGLGRGEIGKVMPIKEFDSEQDKEAMIKAKKAKKITTQDIGLDCPQYDIYINQDLTTPNLHIYKSTRTYAKEN
ncbi:hypothetical protein JTB14_028428 [Gonioctena quinquepunctata]|nr:hypothetical protein JTB14_028428 [Gonioctena quinquepunctata]